MFSNTTSTFRGGLAVFVRNGIPHSSFPPDVDYPSIEYMGVSIQIYILFYVHPGAMNKHIL